MLFLYACAAPVDTDSGTAVSYDPTPSTTLGGDRPAEVVLPATYNVDIDWPLVILLHGYGATATLQDAIFGLAVRADTDNFILVKPEGTVDSSGAQFWNATEECCNFDGSSVDDVAYLSGLIDEAHTNYPLSTVTLVGHSNGGYMAYRMACETPERLDRLVVLAGAVYKDEADCVGTEPVSVIHVHGTEDESVAYASDPSHAGAEESIGRWTTKAGCSSEAAPTTRDYLSAVDGAETTVTRWTGCGDADLQLWSAAGGDHVFLDNNSAFKDDVASWATSGIAPAQ